MSNRSDSKYHKKMSVSFSDPIEEDYDHLDEQQQQQSGHTKGGNNNRYTTGADSDNDNDDDDRGGGGGGGGGFVSDGDDSRQLAPLSNRHSQSNSEVMQTSNSGYPQSNRRGSSAGGGGNNNGALVIPYNQHANHRENNHFPRTTSGNELVLSRRPSAVLNEILSTRRPSALMAALTRPHNQYRPQHQRGGLMMDNIREGQVLGNSTRTINMSMSGGHHNGPDCPEAMDFKRRNRRVGDDALSTALSALYAKVLVIMGVAMPVTEILSNQIPTKVYQGFYFFLYLGSIAFVCFVYAVHMRTRAVFSIIKSYHEKTSNTPIKKRAKHFGSFYLRVGAISFAIGTMVYSGLELGLYFEMNGHPGCSNYLMALTPIARMLLCIIQMQFVFLNTTELDMGRHKVVARFGIMHMVATNLCEWLHVLVEETKHEIYHLKTHLTEHLANHHPIAHAVNATVQAAAVVGAATTESPIVDLLGNSTLANLHTVARRGAEECHRTSIMGTLVQNASPFLFPCTIEYSLICAVILFEMWKQIKTIPNIEKARRSSLKPQTKSAHHFSVDCSGAHRGMFAGILVIVMTIICLIMYFVLHGAPGYEELAIAEVTICECVMYAVMIAAVLSAMFKMRDLKYQRRHDGHHAGTIALDNTLLVLAQTGVYVYAMFSIMAFAAQEDYAGSRDGLVAEVLSLIQTSLQTLFVLNASWRRCKGAQQMRRKPGRQIVTFLLVANMSMWFINTMIKGHAAFRPTHLDFFGIWAWTVITHVSMPLAIFYRFHSTICLFEIWKSAYKNKDHH